MGRSFSKRTDWSGGLGLFVETFQQPFWPSKRHPEIRLDAHLQNIWYKSLYYIILEAKRSRSIISLFILFVKNVENIYLKNKPCGT